MEAKPVDYHSGKKGEVFIATVEQTSIRRREIGDFVPFDICIEVEDIEKAAAKECGRPVNDVMLRMVLSPDAARMLCCDLVDTLAASGDKVALRIRHMMRQALLDVTSETKGLTPEEKDQLKEELGLDDGSQT